MYDQNTKASYSPEEEVVVDFLINGRNELNLRDAKKKFHHALNKANEILKTSNIGYSLYLSSLFELTNIEYQNKERKSLWDKLCHKVAVFLDIDPQNEVTVRHCSDILTSYIQEQYIDKDFAFIKKLFSRLIGKINDLIKNKGVASSSELFVTKASLLRHFSSMQATMESQKQMMDEAIRCIEKSLAINEDTWFSYVELGNCHWKMANFEKKLENFNDKISLAESAYVKSQSIYYSVHNILPLCRLYKETYQTAPFLAAFKLYESTEKNKRRFLQNSYVIAEATIKMYYSNFPAEILLEYLAKSDRLLTEAINAGFNEARTIINLAFIKAIKGELSIGKRVIQTLKTTESDSFDWTTIIDDLEILKESTDLFSQGFVLGIDDAGIWNGLGTFAMTFLDDLNLAIKMYKIALTFNPSNPIAATNLARALVRTDLDISTLKEAEYYISKAESSSTFRFQWWRDVRNEINFARKSALDSEDLAKSSSTPKLSFKFSKIADIYKAYLQLKELKSPQERGFDFEKLIRAYFQLSLGNSVGSHRIVSSAIDQIDAAFFFEKNFYRVEVKWTKKKTDHTDVSDFYFKIKTFGVTGLLISINGFSESAIERAKSLKNEVRLLLMDGEEIELTLKGTISFDQAIIIKQLYFYLQDNPYYRITSRSQLNY
jgi:tetratricopeptide (TPR) repeat protein